MKLRLIGFLCSLAVIAMVVTGSVAVRAEEELDGHFCTLKNREGKIICRTAQRVVAGDRYLNADNRLYQVVKVRGWAAEVKPVNDSQFAPSNVSRLRTALSDLWQGRFWKTEVRAKGPIAIYHTHTDESYLPTQGVNSKNRGSGGIIGVGDAITKAFEEQGIPVIHEKESFVPHDAMAYDRSRRCAAQLLKRRATVLLDVHRDAVPKSEYTTKINNRSVAKVQLVVGRQNPNFSANNDYARRIKQAVDRKYPGLIKGIYYGKGKYNQDLGARAMLIECGTNTDSEKMAMAGARLFAAASKDVLYTSSNRSASRGSWRSAFWIVAGLCAVIGLFFLMNRRGISTIGREFGGTDDPDDPDRNKK